jgi:hypothetical protein
VLKARFARCAQTFTGPRFTRLYRCWLIDREAAMVPVPLAVSEAFAAGRASLECIVLPHDYEPFSPLVRSERAHERQHMAEDREGDEATRGINRSLNRRLNGSPTSPRTRAHTDHRSAVSLTTGSGSSNLHSLRSRQMGRRSVPPPTGVPISAEAEPRT